VTEIITQEDHEKAADCSTLGPHYFTARRVAEQFISKFETEQFKPLIDDFAKQFADKLQSDLDDYLLSNAEMNVQGTMWRMVDDVVKAILGGNRWALERYALGPRYDHDAVRKAVAAHIPRELQDRRIADLEDEIKRLKQDIEWLRR
jgi:hypothetical protein